MRQMPECSVDAICTDPPAGISFMNMKFDSDRGGRKQWVAWLTEIMVEVLRVTKPGGHAFVWALPRTSHWTAWALEDAGWEIRDVCHHIFGSGFPKSLSVDKAIDGMGGKNIGWFGHWLRQERECRGIKQKELAKHFPSKTGGLTGCIANWELGLNTPTVEQFNKLCQVLDLPFDRLEEAEREVVGRGISGKTAIWADGGMGDFDLTTPATEPAKQWEGWGSSLKPAVENWILCRKPLSESSIARQVLSTGTGAINIAATRVGSAQSWEGNTEDSTGLNGYGPGDADGWKGNWTKKSPSNPSGRFPANLLLNHFRVEILRLSSTIPLETKRVIWEYFDGYDDVSAVWQAERSTALGGTNQKVLQHPMRGRVEARAGEEKDSAAMPPVRRDIPVHSGLGEERTTEILHQEVQEPISRGPNRREESTIRHAAHRREPSEDISKAEGAEGQLLREEALALAGRLHSRWVQGSSDNGTSGRRSGDSGANENEAGLCAGASSGCSPQVGATPAERRDSTPSQRSEAGQPGRESRDSGERAPLSQASGHDSGDCQVAPTEPNLDVLASDVPRAWLKYFEPTGLLFGCQRVGTKRVRGNQGGSFNRVLTSKGYRGGGYGQIKWSEHAPTELEKQGYADPDGMEEVEEFCCVEGCPILELDRQSGQRRSSHGGGNRLNGESVFGTGKDGGRSQQYYDQGGASRFFSQFHEPDTGPGFLYQAKASRAERNDFTKSLPRTKNERKRYQQDLSKRWQARVKNHHPTVKPLGLCDWLVKLVCPPGGVVLDPFMGSGSIGCSAVRQGFNFIGIDQEAEYVTIAKRRLEHHAAEIEKAKTERLFA